MERLFSIFESLLWCDKGISWFISCQRWRGIVTSRSWIFINFLLMRSSTHNWASEAFVINIISTIMRGRIWIKELVQLLFLIFTFCTFPRFYRSLISRLFKEKLSCLRSTADCLSCKPLTNLNWTLGCLLSHFSFSHWWLNKSWRSTISHAAIIWIVLSWARVLLSCLRFAQFWRWNFHMSCLWSQRLKIWGIIWAWSRKIIRSFKRWFSFASRNTDPAIFICELWYWLVICSIVLNCLELSWLSANCEAWVCLFGRIKLGCISSWRCAKRVIFDSVIKPLWSFCNDRLGISVLKLLIIGIVCSSVWRWVKSLLNNFLVYIADPFCNELIQHICGHLIEALGHFRLCSVFTFAFRIHRWFFI